MTSQRGWNDDAGTRHDRAASSARIVSLVPSITELLFDLDLGSQVVGRTTYCIHPADHVAGIPSVGGTKKIRRDRLLALEPSHIIVNIDENPKELSDEIGAEGIEVVVTHPLEPRDNLRLFALIGGIFGRECEAGHLSARFERIYEETTVALEGSPSRSVLYLIWKDPWMTVSRDTYISRMLALANWETAAHEPAVRYPEVSLAPDLLATLDLVLFATEPYRFTQADVDDFSVARLVRPPRARLIDGEMVSWYGSRAIAGLGYLRTLASGEGR